jgi:hypothetical protein
MAHCEHSVPEQGGPEQADQCMGTRINAGKRMTQQLELLPSGSQPTRLPLQWEASRDEAMRAIVEYAGQRFLEQAKKFVLRYLAAHGESSGEDITDACVAAGITPHDERAFGPVYMSLARKGLIVKAGMTIRRKGHGTAGGNIWRLR